MVYIYTKARSRLYIDTELGSKEFRSFGIDPARKLAKVEKYTRRPDEKSRARKKKGERKRVGRIAEDKTLPGKKGWNERKRKKTRAASEGGK